jgi:hypothetical protein
MLLLWNMDGKMLTIFKMLSHAIEGFPQWHSEYYTLKYNGFVKTTKMLETGVTNEKYKNSSI